MNLQEIQKRMAELSAEMLDLSIKMSTIIGGKRVKGVRTIVDWSQLTHLDRISITEDFIPPYSEGKVRAAGEYTVVAVESSDYEGMLSVQIKHTIGQIKHTIGQPFWINARDMIRLGILTKI